MKIRNIITLGLAASVGFTLPAEAQEKKLEVRAFCVKKAKDDKKGKENKKRKASKLSVVKIVSSPKAGTFLEQINADETKEVNIEKTYSVFYVETPKSLVAALRLYAELDFAKALKDLSKVRKQLEDWAGLPEGPYLRAYRAEVECAVRSLKFEEAKKTVDELAGSARKLLTPQDEVTGEAVQLLVSAQGTEPAEMENKIKEIVQKYGKSITPHQYGWLYYALGMAYESTIPAEQLSSNAISAEHQQNASKAIDAYCVAGISSHGAHMELPVAGMKKAQRLLWAMPGVQAEVKAYGHPTPQKFKKASQNFQDAVTLAYMLINVYGEEAAKDSPLAKAAAMYQNTKAKKK